ncbi:unnamed protein product [Acanthoscelides obtectus]|uniref:Uncharacterized protein n=1 Tax=Acanthoscelides obtectus TaxID=200917 RepID=A0A9P0KNL6_ACAOB|nr:unnamed protein product [Acanthoscelides obtectus]CAK1641714.1 hypothetical protein AOBTE_LOCUS12579 [Acanthoscelides obtectus]
MPWMVENTPVVEWNRPSDYFYHSPFVEERN